MKMFSVLKEKTALLENSERHSDLLFDELKLSENKKMNHDAIIQGYVDYGPNHTPEDEKTLTCNHGLVFLCQPFKGDWVQILGCLETIKI